MGDTGVDVTYDFITSAPEENIERIVKERETIDGAVNSYKKVFIVHGHDDKAKTELSNFVFRLGLTPIILHEQPNGGNTIIEKFELYSSDVQYAFVLLTPDNIGGIDEKNLKPRARENVILEMGYFMGKLGRNKVCCLHKGGLEIPSDILGILYLKFEESIIDRRFDIVQELVRAGYNIKLS